MVYERVFNMWQQRSFFFFCIALMLCSICWSQANFAATSNAHLSTIVIVSTDFVAQAKFDQLKDLAEQQQLSLEVIRVHELAEKKPALEQAELLLADGPRPSDQQAIQQALEQLGLSPPVYLQVGGGAPAWQGVEREVALTLITYYQQGGLHNFRQWLQAWKQVVQHRPIMVEPIQELPAQGIYHPKAPYFFSEIGEYDAWYSSYAKQADKGKVVFLVSPTMITDMHTEPIEQLVLATEQAHLQPIVVWMTAESQALRHWLDVGSIDAIVNLTHLFDAQERVADIEALDVPIIQTTTYRDGTKAQYIADYSGVNARTTASFLAVPETWGLIDPLVISAIEQGNVSLMPEQVQLLVEKLQRIAYLRHTPAVDKKLAILFWNYPAGEKNLGASHLNIPRSVQSILTALEQAGYKTSSPTEATLIQNAQRMLALVYGSAKPEELLAENLAVAYPIQEYKKWFASLPVEQQAAINQWGAIEQHPLVIRHHEKLVFVLPRLELGNVWLVPQLPRSPDRSTQAYHDQGVAPDHAYMALYLLLQQRMDALVHLGTHGSQEWLGGKDRGLWAFDYSFLAAGSLPIFYPYIQDNIGEAIQAKRRGRAVTISHQTPPFAPAGLYDSLRDVHALIHEYEQLDEGAVQNKLITQLVEKAQAEGFMQDMQWQREQATQNPHEFIQALHDYLHELALAAMPLGLHHFGQAAELSHRVSTVMQQLGAPFYEWLAPDDDELLVIEGAQLEQSLPFNKVLHYLQSAGNSPDWDEQEREWAAKARSLDAVLNDPQENEQLLHALAGGHVLAGAGGDPIRQPGLQSGRNLYAFEASKLPARAAYEAGGAAWQQLVEDFKQQHQGQQPEKVVFSLWSSEAIRHLGVTESQILHALGLQPEWDEAGRVIALTIIPRDQLKAGRTDVVVQVTSVYRDQFDHFMRLLAKALEQLAELDEADNAVYLHAQQQKAKLLAQGLSLEQAAQVAHLRIFSNQPGDYGTGMPAATLQSDQWEQEGELAQLFLERLQYGYSSTAWGIQFEHVNALAEQLQGVQAAVLSRSSTLHGMLSTDHPFEYLGGLGLATRHVSGQSPALYVSDARQAEIKLTSATRFMSEELRSRYFNPAWIKQMQQEGYAGTLEMLNVVNNWFGWQVTSPESVRDDQWQQFVDIYVNDKYELGLEAWFEQHNPTAQAQLIERMLEAVRKAYWQPDEKTVRDLMQRWQALQQHPDVQVVPYQENMMKQLQASGYDLTGLESATLSVLDQGALEPTQTAQTEQSEMTTVSGQVLTQVNPTDSLIAPWKPYLPILLFLILLAGVGRQLYQSKTANY